MTASRLIKKRNATIAVTANADVLFLPGGDVNRWHRRFSTTVRRATARAAPSNKRPRWMHYGKPLKRSIVASRSRFIRHASGPRLYSAVGSTAPYAKYVDQGTGIFAGRSPWKAKILPPWPSRGRQLYEHTWRPPGSSTTVRPVMIKGQRPQRFFAAGLKRGFQLMGMASHSVPDVDPRIGEVMRTWPRGLENFAGNTPWSAAFDTQLRIWRQQRDAVWALRRTRFPEGPVRPTRRQAADLQRALKAQARAERDRSASERAAERRKNQQIAALKEKERAKELGKAKRAAEEARAKALRNLSAGNAESERTAREFHALIKKIAPDARIGSHRLDDGVIMWQVRYTDVNGEVRNEKWAYGY